MSRVIGIIPAHLNSTRFPRKVLAMIAGKTMLEWVWEAAKDVGFDDLVLATPDAELGLFGQARGWEVQQTSHSHKRCMDCVAEAASAMAVSAGDLIVNVQSDEPLVSADEIRALIEWRQTRFVDAAIMARPLLAGQMEDPNAVKIVRSADGRMLYSTRAPIKSGLRIAGMFAMDAATLAEFHATPESPLERLEACDSNRMMDHPQFRVTVYVAPRACPSVDVPADLVRVEQFLKGA